jgi:hypothetical protein
LTFRNEFGAGKVEESRNLVFCKVQGVDRELQIFDLLSACHDELYLKQVSLKVNFLRLEELPAFHRSFPKSWHFNFISKVDFKNSIPA